MRISSRKEIAAVTAFLATSDSAAPWPIHDHHVYRFDAVLKVIPEQDSV